MQLNSIIEIGHVRCTFVISLCRHPKKNVAISNVLVLVHCAWRFLGHCVHKVHENLELIDSVNFIYTNGYYT
jgi:hypothetical protein